MDLLPEDKQEVRFNFAPMIDFLFLMLALFATLAVSRASLLDTKIDLLKHEKEKAQTALNNETQMHYVNIGVTDGGTYKWLTEVDSHSMDDLEKIKQEIYRQYAMGIIPKDKSQTKVLLHIDKQAPWEKIAELLFSVRKTGFEVCPIYEQN
jgi:biopolymer transport protein ExbD